MVIESGDTVVLYGREDGLRELSTHDESDRKAHEEVLDGVLVVLEEQNRLID